MSEATFFCIKTLFLGCLLYFVMNDFDLVHQVEELRGQGAEQYAYKWEKDTVQISSTRCTSI